MIGAARIRWISYFLCLILVEPVVGGQAESLVFSSLRLPGGAAFNRVQSIAQDDAGFIWLGTEGGLLLYDGYDARVFQHRPEDPGSLSSNSITALLVDSAGTLWVGVESRGLHRFERSTESFTRLAVDGRDGPLDHSIYGMFEDSGGRLWVAGDGGVTYLENGNPVEAQFSLPTYVVSEDSAGNLWAGFEYGLARFDRQRGGFEIEPRASLDGDNESGVEIWRLIFDDRDRIWFGGTQTGLRRFDPMTGELTVFRHLADDPDSLVTDDVYALAYSGNSAIWVGTYGGLDRFDLESETFAHIPTRPGVPGAISHPYIMDLYQDRQGTLWVATFGAGLNVLRQKSAGSRYFVHDPLNANSLSGNHAQSVLVASDGGVWVGTYNAGLNYLDPATGQIVRYPSLAKTESRQPRRIWDLLEDRHGRLWIASSDGVLVQRDQGFATLAQEYPDLPALGIGDIWGLEADSRGVIWIATFGSGLFALDPDQVSLAKLESGSPEFPGLLDDFLTDLAFDADSRLLVGTYSAGLQVLVEGQFETIDSVSDVYAITKLLPRPGGELWVGTRGNGLHRLQDDKKVAHYDVADGLPSDFVESLGIDGEGRLWVTTDHGLAFLDPDSDRFRQVRLFAEAEGRVYSHGALDVDDRGMFWVGADDGLLEFDPGNLDATVPVPSVVVTRMTAHDQTYSLALQKAAQNLQLDHTHSNLVFEFAALQFFQADMIEYAYRLDGNDEEWIATRADRRVARYTNLNPGSYQFLVRARNPGGDWSEPTVPLSLHINPPAWRSAWAFAGYALLLLALAATAIRSAQARATVRADHHRQLEAREKRLELALWGSGDWLWDWDVPGQRIFCPEMCRFIGVLGGDGWLSLDRFNRALNPQDLEFIISDSRRRLFDVDDLEYQFRIRDASGESQWMQVRGRVVERQADSRPLRVTGTCKNINAQKTAERGLRLSARILENSNDAVAILDLDLCFMQVNRAFERVTGYPESEVVGQSVRLLDSGVSPSGYGDQIRQTLARKGNWHGDIWERKKSGELFYSDLRLSAVSDEGSEVSNYVAVFSDITRRHRSEEELRYLANYDALTGLPNRTLFGERLAHAAIKARRRISRVVVMLVDLDEFKTINESYGNRAGDLILQAAAERLVGVMREEDTIARLSADEFAILVEGTESDREVQDLSKVVLNAMKTPFSLDDQELNLNASIGISVYPDHGNDAPTLIQNAQTALSAAKDESRGQARFYAGDLRESALNRIRLVEELGRVIERDELELHFQPKVRSRDRSICGVEALLRWRHGKRGLISPDQFIPLAERRGHILEIGEWVLHTACRQIMELGNHGLSPIPLAVNVSPRQLEDDRLLGAVTAELAKSGLDPGLLQLELTESTLMTQASQGVRALERLKDLSVKLVVDDFGTGYSSLSYINRLPVDHIKIDKTFVENLEHDRYSQAIVSAVLSMADSLDLRVTAEGIEREDQFEYLRKAGCREIQGFLIARPMEFDDLVTFLKTYQADSPVDPCH